MVAVVTGAAIGLPVRVSRWLVSRGGCSIVVVVLVLTLLAMAVALLGGLMVVGVGECGWGDGCGQGCQSQQQRRDPLAPGPP
ncbi:MAG: hypothetical protein VKM34_11005 [Cyanobacteriota bacterium]|nr:hypothetical protein [Cyanobacteriota bacterium]